MKEKIAFCINDLHYLCNLHVRRVKDVFRKLADVGDGRLSMH